MPRINYSITNRDFYFLIDSSGSTADPLSLGDNRRRFDYIRDCVDHNICRVLTYRQEGKPICSEVTVAFFNTNKVSKNIYKISDHSQIKEKFRFVKPDGTTNIAPTFKHLMSQWLENRKQSGTDAAVVVYVDGLVDDFKNFVAEIKNVASQIEHHSHLKILIIGITDAINHERTVQWYFELDLNGFDFRDANGQPVSIVTFDRMDDVEEMGGVIPAIEAQLIENSETGLPDWLAEEFPDLYQKLKQKYNCN